MYLEFLKAYRAWLDDGAPIGYSVYAGFTRGSGLCPNLRRYVVTNGGDGECLYTALETLRDRLIVCFGDEYYPFNKNGSFDYLAETRTLTAYSNPKRIAFVDAEIERLEAE